MAAEIWVNLQDRSWPLFPKKWCRLDYLSPVFCAALSWLRRVLVMGDEENQGVGTLLSFLILFSESEVSVQLILSQLYIINSDLPKIYKLV